ncbi:hypothetical protein JCM33374_g4623 [Metschnikowia sp. JCM 33374]|nr:hypothetical protein JCM33374_g4623 [Metschnikowia sp. JCM 33374]
MGICFGSNFINTNGWLDMTLQPSIYSTTGLTYLFMITRKEEEQSDANCALRWWIVRRSWPTSTMSVSVPSSGGIVLDLANQ